MARDYVLQPFRAAVDWQIDYRNELNPQQLAAVTAPPGPSLVLAGAGAGKTRTLTYRVAYLLEQGVPADRILLLTFTNKAAREMMRRVADLLGNELSGLWGGTFHSIGHRILRRHADLAGYRNNFTILDREDAKDLLKTCVTEAGIDPTATLFPKADVLLELFSFALNTRKSIPETLATQFRYFNAQLAPQFEHIAAVYQARKRDTNVMDFDDLLALWLKLLEDHEDLRLRYQNRFEFVLVDEYQDTNRLQAELIDLLVARHRNVTVVGDDSQSIYSWRGANFKNILGFPQRYPEARIFKIETNYRSTPQILDVANAAIAANKNQFAKTLTPARRPGEKPAVVLCEDGNQQAAFVAQRLLQLREEGRNLNQMAVLYRSHFHTLELQLELTRRNIPFTITSGIRFFEQAHLKDVVAYLKLVANPRDELAFKRLVQLLPGIGGKGADKLWKLFHAATQLSAQAEPAKPEQLSTLNSQLSTPQAPAKPEQLSTLNSQLSTQAERPLATTLLAPALARMGGAVPKKATVAWANFVTTIAQLEADPVRDHPDQMLKLVIEAGYDEYLKENYTNYRSRLEDLEELASFARQINGTHEFLAQLSLLTNIEAEDEQVAARDDEHLRLSTIHQAKGLEFDVVFVIMLCDGLFPSARSSETPEGEEEERRLFYVAITRAKSELYLSFPMTRATYGRGDAVQHPSRFLKEIPSELMDPWNLRSASWGTGEGSEPF